MVIRENVRNNFFYLVLCLALFPLLGERVVVAFHSLSLLLHEIIILCVITFQSSVYLTHDTRVVGAFCQKAKGKKAIEGLSENV